MNRANLEPEINNSFSGQLSKTSVPYLLVYLQNNVQTGFLDISSKYEITIFTDRGIPYFAAGASSETLLGKILLNKNKITKYQYDRAVEEIKKDKDKRIGEILVNLGMITPHELNEYLDLQLREKVLESFLYLEGDFKFTPEDQIRNDLFYCKLNSSEIIYDGFSRYVFASDTNLDLMNIDIKENLQDDIANLGLGPREQRLVQLLGQKKSLSEIESSGQFKNDDILRVVLLLGLNNRIEIKDTKINDLLLELFKNYTVMNPLPDPVDSNYTVRESELTDPTGEVLLLDDELEATAEREKLEVESDDNKDEVLINLEPEVVEEIKIEPESVTNEPKAEESRREVEYIELDPDSSGDEEMEIKAGNDDIEFQQTYEGTQKGIDLDPESKESPADESIEEPEIPEESPVDTGGEDDHSANDIARFFDYIADEEDYYKILNIPKGASVDEVKEAYFKSIKKFHPDANMNFPEDIRIKAERIFTKVTKAYEILSDEHKRKTFDEKEELTKFKEQANSIYEAEIIYSEGEMLLRQRNFKEAEKKFKEAIALNPDESAYIGINAWTKYLGAPDKEVVFEDVKKELKSAIELDGNIAENYYYLASVYKFSENLGSAEKYFVMAIEKDPNYIEAKRELRLLKSRKGKKEPAKTSSKKIEKKFWSGLFKK